MHVMLIVGGNRHHVHLTTPLSTTLLNISSISGMLDASND